MTKVWSQKEKYRIWFEIEAYACEAMEQIGLVPEGTTKMYLRLVVSTTILMKSTVLKK